MNIDDDLLSRFHCYIKFDSVSNCWNLFDGNLDENNKIKHSTNGTWIYLKEETEIKHNFIFKSNQTVFKAYLT